MRRANGRLALRQKSKQLIGMAFSRGDTWPSLERDSVYLESKIHKRREGLDEPERPLPKFGHQPAQRDK